MSNGTQEQSRNNGNRNRNRNRNNGGRNNSNRPHNPDQKNHNRSLSQHQSFVNRKPVKLTFWQKILKLIGLYKEPTKGAKPESKGGQGKPKFEGPRPERGPRSEKQTPRSNTRDARQGGEGRAAGEPRPPRAPRERREPTLADVESTRLYIGNLSYDATESDIEELFKGIGPVRSVEVVYNKHTHKSKGYGFVEMLRIDEAKRSVEVLHDQHFMGRQLIVSGAKAKNAEDIAEHAAARERKEQAVASSAAAPHVDAAETAAVVVEETAAVVVEEAAAVVVEEAAAVVVEETVAVVVEETVAVVVEETVSEVATVIEAVVEGGVIEEVHSLEADSQKENFS
jgi:hypothetical protein